MCIRVYLPGSTAEIRFLGTAIARGHERPIFSLPLSYYFETDTFCIHLKTGKIQHFPERYQAVIFARMRSQVDTEVTPLVTEFCFLQRLECMYRTRTKLLLQIHKLNSMNNACLNGQLTSQS